MSVVLVSVVLESAVCCLLSSLLSITQKWINTCSLKVLVVQPGRDLEGTASGRARVVLVQCLRPAGLPHDQRLCEALLVEVRVCLDGCGHGVEPRRPPMHIVVTDQPRPQLVRVVAEVRARRTPLSDLQSNMPYSDTANEANEQASDNFNQLNQLAEDGTEMTCRRALYSNKSASDNER